MLSWGQDGSSWGQSNCLLEGKGDEHTSAAHRVLHSLECCAVSLFEAERTVQQAFAGDDSGSTRTLACCQTWILLNKLDVAAAGSRFPLYFSVLMVTQR